ncbi:MAG: DUF2062 domain-containing protein [Desulfobacterales bacterium]|jgi:uncharacterized protein (DUF2062 family)
MLDKSGFPKEIKIKKKDNLQNALRRVYARFVKIRGRPREIALGFALGIFIGMTPTMGIQMPIAVFFAAVLKWSKISAAFGVWITNPFTSPFIYGITYIVGVKLLGLKVTMTLPDNFSWSIVQEMLKNAPMIFGALTVGGILIGLPLAVLSYYLSFAAVNKYQQSIKEKVAAQKTRLVNTKEKVKKKIRKRRMKN